MLALAVQAGKFANRPPLPLIRFAATTGWRRAKCLGLTRKRVDFGHGIVRFEPATTKNPAGRDAGRLADARKELPIRSRWSPAKGPHSPPCCAQHHGRVEVSYAATRECVRVKN